MTARRKVFRESDYGSPNEQKKLEQLITLISGISSKQENWTLLFKWMNGV